MLSWKLLAVFHDPIHDFGLNTGRMSSIVKYIQNVKEQIIAHKQTPIPTGEVNVSGYSGSGVWSGGRGRRFATNRNDDSEFFEEQNVARSVEVVDQSDNLTAVGKMYANYDIIFSDYISLRNWFIEETRGTTGYDRISTKDNNLKLSQLQRYSQFFESITKLIDLFKLLIVIQVVEKHKRLEEEKFCYNNVHKQTVLTAIDDLIFALNDTVKFTSGGIAKNTDSDDTVEVAEKISLGRALLLISVIFNQLSSDKCVLQLDLLNSTTFNNIVRIFFSCYFYDEGNFWNIMGNIHPTFQGMVTLTQFAAAQRRLKLEHKSFQDQPTAVAEGFQNFYKKLEDFYAVVMKEEETDNKQAAAAAGGGRRKRRNSLRSFILKGGASKKLERWTLSQTTHAVQHTDLDSLLTKWKTELRQKLVSNVKQIEERIMDTIYEEFVKFYNELTKINVVSADGKSNESVVRFHFPAFFNKMNKDFEYHTGKVAGGTRAGNRTNPKAMVVTCIYEYMNELTIEIDALKAELDNSEKKLQHADEDFSIVDTVDKTVTNRISKLFARKGLEYAKARLTKISILVSDPHNGVCIRYVEDILSRGICPPPPNVPDSASEYKILLNHIHFLGMAYIQKSGVLPNIDTKLLTFWHTHLTKHPRLIRHDRLLGIITRNSTALQAVLNKKDKRSGDITNKNTLRVINNGIPSDLKKHFQKFVVCPASSVADAMGAFGSCAGAKKITEYHNMSVSIEDSNTSDLYNVNSKIDGHRLESVVNSFNLDFGTDQEQMFIECIVGNIDLNGAPTVLSANNVFKVTLEALEIIMKSVAEFPVTVEDLWSECDKLENFKKILTPTSKKATGDINQELNSVVINGGYIQDDTATPDKLNQINTCFTIGLAGDRPSGARMALTALYADASGLLKNYFVGYGGSDNETTLVVRAPAVAAAAGGSIRKTKFRKQKMIKTRKNKLYHYKMMSKRRKYNNKTKNRK